MLLAVALAMPLALAQPDPEPAAPDDGDVRAGAATPVREGEEEVTVEGRSAKGADPSATSASVTVVEVDESLAGSADVAQVLDSVSGTTVVHLGGLGDYSAVSIRGSSLRQVQVYIDGVPLNPDGSEVVNLSELPLQAFDRVLVWRGNAPPAYAASPIGGVVDLHTTERPGSTAAVSGGQHGTLGSFVMSGFEARAGSRPLRGLLLADVFHTRGDFTYFDDNSTIYVPTDDRLRTRDNNEKSQLSTLARLRWGDDRLSLSLQDSLLYRDEGVAGPIQQPAEQASLATLRNLAVAQVEARGVELQGHARLWSTQRQETWDDRLGELGTTAEWERSWLSTQGLHLHGAWIPRPWLVPTLTLSLRRDAYVLADRLSERVEEPRVRWSGGAALAADLRLWADRVTLSPVLQGQWIDNRALGDVPFGDTPVAPDDRQVTLAPTPRLGLLLRPWQPLALKANIARNVRPPDLSELFGDRGAVVGNTELSAEKGLTWDVGGRLAWPETGIVDGSLDVAHFWSRTEDLIVLVQNSQRTSIPVNFGLAWVQGLEAALDLDVLGRIDSDTSLTWTLSRNLTPDPSVADNQLPRIPEWELWQATGVHWQEWIRLGHTWSYTSGNYWDATNFYRAAPRSIHGAFLRVQPHRAWPSLELSVLNLTDRIVQVVPRNPLDETDDAWIVDAITDYSGYPLAGRTWLVTVRWTPESAGANP